MMVATNQLISEVVVKDSASAVADRISAGMDKLAAAEAGVQDQTARSTRALESSARQFENLKTAVDPVYAAQKRLADIQIQVQNAVDRGTASQAEAAQVLDMWTKRLGPTSAPLDTLSNKLKLSYTNVEILKSGLINTFQSIAAGMNPVQTLTTQLAQTAPALIAVGAGAGASTAALVTLGGGIGAVVIGLGALAIAYQKGAAQTTAFNRAVQLTGNAADVTRGSFDAIVRAATDASDVSATTIRAIATNMVASGKLVGPVIQQLASMTADYAAATGQNAAKAGQELTKLFSDPLKGMQQLDDAYNLLSAAERRRIQDLVEQGNRTQAQIELADQLNTRIKGAATDGLGSLERAWNAVKGAASGAWDAMLGLGRGQSLEQQLASAQAALEKLRAGAAQTKGASSLLDLLPGGGGAQQNSNQTAIDATQAMIARLQVLIDANNRAAQNDATRSALQEETKSLDQITQSFDNYGTTQERLANQASAFQKAITDTRAELDKLGASERGVARGPYLDLLDTLTRLEKGLNATRAAAAAAQTPQDAAKEALSIAQQVAGTAPSNRAYLQAYLTAKQDALRNPAVYTQENPEAAAEAIARSKAAQATIQQTTALRDQNSELATNTRLTLGTAEAWLRSGSAGQAAAAQQQVAVEALTQPINAQARAQQLTAKSVADAANSGAQLVQSLEAQAAAQQRLAEAAKGGPLSEKAVELNNQIIDQTRNLKIALDNATDPHAAQVLASEIERIEAALRGSAKAANDNQITQLFQQQSQQLQLVQAQIGTIGLGSDAQSTTLARLQEEISLRNSNLNLTQQQVDALVDGAGKIAEMNIALDRQRQIAAEIPNFIGQAFDQIGQAVTQLNVAGQDAMTTIGNLGKAILGEIEQELIKLAIINPLKNALSGGHDTTLSDLFNSGSGLFGSIGNWLFGSNPAGSLSGGGPRGFSSGGSVSGGVPILVGEQGPEIWTPSANGTIIPNNRLMAANSNAAPIINIIDQRQSGADIQTQQSTGPNGQKQIDILVRDSVNRQLGAGAFDKALKANFGSNRVASVRR